jgi:hypothetical protein
VLDLKVGEVATPFVPVVACTVFVPPAKVPLGPVLGAVKVTVTPLTAFPKPSWTVAAKPVGKLVLMGSIWPDPLVAVMAAGAPATFVNKKVGPVVTAGLAPVTNAVTVNAPALLLAVSTADVAIPCVLVVAVVTPPAKVPFAPLVPAEAVKVTETPATGFLDASVTVACNGVVKEVPTVAVCGLPAVTAIAAGGPALLVSEKLVVTDGFDVTNADTWYDPNTPLAVGATGVVATPVETVVAVVVVAVPEKVALAPVAGAWNVTDTLGITFPPPSVTTTLNADPKAFPTEAPCPLPLFTAMAAGAPTRLVSEKLAPVVTPVTVAVTV